MKESMSYVIYLHGFRSIAGSSSKAESLACMLPQETIISLEYMPHKPDEASAAIDTLVAELGEKNITGFVGTSLGGFWARWAATKYKIAAIAINPSLEPWATLPTGEFSCYGSDTLIQVTQADLQAFKNYLAPDAGAVTMHVVAMDDDVLDADRMLTLIGEDCLWQTRVFEAGGHRFEGIERLRGAINIRFYNTENI